MQHFHWTRAKSVYIDEFDAEHRNLYQIADSLQKAVAAGAAADALVVIVRALLNAAEDHFTHEERTMRAARYPLLAWHKRQHDAARASVTAMLKRIKRGDAKAPEELLKYLADWLKNHMAVTDRMMAAFLRTQSRSNRVHAA